MEDVDLLLLFLIRCSLLQAPLHAKMSWDVLALTVRKATEWGEFFLQRPRRSTYWWLWTRLNIQQLSPIILHFYSAWKWHSWNCSFRLTDHSQEEGKRSVELKANSQKIMYIPSQVSPSPVPKYPELQVQLKDSQMLLQVETFSSHVCSPAAHSSKSRLEKEKDIEFVWNIIHEWVTTIYYIYRFINIISSK